MPSDWKAQWAGARKQLRALDYDAPAVPDVDDAMQALYLTAGGNESGDPIVGQIPVPPAVRDEAMRALRMAHKHNYGAWNFIGVARAIQLAVVPRIGQKSVDRMRAFFTRHAKDANAPHFGDNKHPSRGYLAHLVWGGDPAKAWVMNTEKRMRRNPLQKPFESLAFYIVRPRPGIFEVYLYDTADVDGDMERALVAGAMVSVSPDPRNRKKPKWEATGMAAVRGYGPLLYDLTATLLGKPLHATKERTTAAKAFWAKQPHSYIEPLSPAEFEAKYGVKVQELYARRVELTDDEMRQLKNYLVETFTYAAAEEKRGAPIQLKRETPK